MTGVARTAAVVVEPAVSTLDSIALRSRRISGADKPFFDKPPVFVAFVISSSLASWKQESQTGRNISKAGDITFRTHNEVFDFKVARLSNHVFVNLQISLGKTC